MSFNRISAAEAASLIKHGYNIGLSGFTPAGTAKAVTAELAKIAEAEHAKGNPFQVGIFTGASTGESCDGVMSRAKAIRYRAPYTTNSDFRKAVNNGEIAYNDIHLSQMAQEVRYGFMGKVNVAIIEACEVTPDGKIYLTAAGGISPTICRLADQIIVELPHPANPAWVCTTCTNRSTRLTAAKSPSTSQVTASDCLIFR